jgi:hypothetical protein
MKMDKMYVWVVYRLTRDLSILFHCCPYLKKIFVDWSVHARVQLCTHLSLHELKNIYVLIYEQLPRISHLSDSMAATSRGYQFLYKSIPSFRQRVFSCCSGTMQTEIWNKILCFSEETSYIYSQVGLHWLSTGKFTN